MWQFQVLIRYHSTSIFYGKWNPHPTLATFSSIKFEIDFRLYVGCWGFVETMLFVEWRRMFMLRRVKPMMDSAPTTKTMARKSSSARQQLQGKTYIHPKLISNVSVEYLCKYVNYWSQQMHALNTRSKITRWARLIEHPVISIFHNWYPNWLCRYFRDERAPLMKQTSEMWDLKGASE